MLMLFSRRRLPLVASIGKGSALFIDCNLRNALLDHTSWGVQGHSTQSVKELLQCVLTEE